MAWLKRVFNALAKNLQYYNPFCAVEYSRPMIRDQRYFNDHELMRAFTTCSNDVRSYSQAQRALKRVTNALSVLTLKKTKIHEDWPTVDLPLVPYWGCELRVTPERSLIGKFVSKKSVNYAASCWRVQALGFALAMTVDKFTGLYLGQSFIALTLLSFYDLNIVKKIRTEAAFFTFFKFGSISVQNFSEILYWQRSGIWFGYPEQSMTLVYVVSTTINDFIIVAVVSFLDASPWTRKTQILLLGILLLYWSRAWYKRWLQEDLFDNTDPDMYLWMPWNIKKLNLYSMALSGFWEFVIFFGLQFFNLVMHNGCSTVIAESATLDRKTWRLPVLQQELQTEKYLERFFSNMSCSNPDLNLSFSRSASVYTVDPTYGPFTTEKMKNKNFRRSRSADPKEVQGILRLPSVPECITSASTWNEGRTSLSSTRFDRVGSNLSISRSGRYISKSPSTVSCSFSNISNITDMTTTERVALVDGLFLESLDDYHGGYCSNNTVTRRLDFGGSGCTSGANSRTHSRTNSGVQGMYSANISGATSGAISGYATCGTPKKDRPSGGHDAPHPKSSSPDNSVMRRPTLTSATSNCEPANEGKSAIPHRSYPLNKLQPQLTPPRVMLQRAISELLPPPAFSPLVPHQRSATYALGDRRDAYVAKTKP